MIKGWKLVTVYSLVILIMLLVVNAGNRALTVFWENQGFRRTHCIIIDPGHGGEDGGAVSYNGLPESGYNLAISLKLNDLLNLLGYQTKMIRTTDVSVYSKGETLSQKKVSDLKERVKLINETDGALLISIHQNHYPDSRYSGAQVFYTNSKESEQLAKQLQEVFVLQLNPGSHRQAKKSSGIYIMENIHCPGVLIECGFLSNVSEEAKLKEPSYQKKLSSIIATTICDYLSNT